MFSVHKSNLSTLRHVNQNFWTLGSDIYSLNRVKFRGMGQLWRHINLTKYILVWKFLLKCNHVHVGKIWILSTYANQWHTSHFLASLSKNRPKIGFLGNFFCPQDPQIGQKHQNCEKIFLLSQSTHLGVSFLKKSCSDQK